MKLTEFSQFQLSLACHVTPASAPLVVTPPTLPMIGANKTGDEFFPPGARACVSCGLLWSKGNPTLLGRVLREGGNEETRKRFGAADGGEAGEES